MQQTKSLNAPNLALLLVLPCPCCKISFCLCGAAASNCSAVATHIKERDLWFYNVHDFLHEICDDKFADLQYPLSNRAPQNNN